MHPWGKSSRIRVIIKTVYNFVDSKLEISSKVEWKYFQERELNNKRRGRYGVALPVRWNKWVTLEKKIFSWGTRGREKLYRLTTKWTSFKAAVKDFSYTLRAPSTDCFKSIASHKKWIFLKNWLLFGSLFSDMRHNSSVTF